MIEPVDRDQPGQWVYRPDRVQAQHVCELAAEWPEGAFWQCRDGHLWICRTLQPWETPGIVCCLPEWRPATWWQRRCHGGRRAKLAMANENRLYRATFTAPPELLAPGEQVLSPEQVRRLAVRSRCDRCGAVAIQGPDGELHWIASFQQAWCDHQVPPPPPPPPFIPLA